MVRLCGVCGGRSLTLRGLLQAIIRQRSSGIRKSASQSSDLGSPAQDPLTR